MRDPRWWNVVGLTLNVIGALVVGWGFLITPAAAERRGQVVLGGAPGDQRNRELSQVRERIAAARNTLTGLLLVVVGFLCQMYGSWPR